MGSGYFRAHQRFSVDLDVVVSVSTRGLYARGRILDLGIGGAACELDQPVRMGEEVELRLASTGETHVFTARVAWMAWAERSSVRAGVHFRDRDAEALAALLGFLGVQADAGSE
jgi:hypothetical protein